MTVGLFVPCYVDQFYPKVAIAALELLEKLGVKVGYPLGQTCCGQPMANSGFENNALETYNHFANTFSNYDYIVTPSASCAYHVIKHYDILVQRTAVSHVRSRTLELVHFITSILQVTNFDVHFPYCVGLHLSCHGQRGLHQANASEITDVREGEISSLLTKIPGIKLSRLDRNDECCGFGGTFCVSEEAVSARMGIDRVMDHVKNGTEILTGGDMSCLMQLECVIKRQNIPIRVMHIAEILNGDKP